MVVVGILALYVHLEEDKAEVEYKSLTSLNHEI